jgi:hypothetical protein
MGPLVVRRLIEHATVRHALARLRVVAYDTGALGEVVATTGLISLGDERGFCDS